MSETQTWPKYKGMIHLHAVKKWILRENSRMGEGCWFLLIYFLDQPLPLSCTLSIYSDAGICKYSPQETLLAVCD